MSRENSSVGGSEPRAGSKPAAVKRQAAKKSPQQVMDATVGPLIAAYGGNASVAVEDLTTGAYATYGGRETYDTASIVKVDILATLLYQHQRSGESLTAGERELATAMITASDNNAASALYDDDGGATGIDAANEVFGMRDTSAGTGGLWGLTSTSAEDQVRLLRQVCTGSSVLSPDSRDYITYLMRHVEPGQQWGVPAAADSGTFEVKNGWLPNPSLWVINSIGEVTRNGHRLLIAVLSHDNGSESGGISLVEDVARKSAAAVAGK